MQATTSTASVAHNALPPQSSSTAARSSRISTHSHIKGLGLTADGFASPDAAGFVGQTNAREVPSSSYYLSPCQGGDLMFRSYLRPVVSL
jgi:TIP49 P-loop domain